MKSYHYLKQKLITHAQEKRITNKRIEIAEKEKLDIENYVSRKAEEHDDALQQFNEQMLKRGEDLKNKDVAYSHLETYVAKKFNTI